MGVCGRCCESRGLSEGEKTARTGKRMGLVWVGSGGARGGCIGPRAKACCFLGYDDSEMRHFNPSGLQWVAAAKMLQFGAPRACSGRAKGGDDSTVIVTGRRVGDDGGSGKIASHSSLPSCRSCCVLSFTRWMDKCGYFLYVDSSFGRGMGDYPPRVSLRYLLSHSAGMASFFFPHLPWSVHSPLSPLCALCSLWRCSCTFPPPIRSLTGKHHQLAPSSSKSKSKSKSSISQATPRPPPAASADTRRFTSKEHELATWRVERHFVISGGASPASQDGGV